MQATPVRTSSQLGPMLKQLRRARGLSQRALGAKIGLSQERISAIENHPERVTFDQLLTLLMALDAEFALVPREPDHKVSEGPPTTPGGW